MHNLQQYPSFNDGNAQFATVPSLWWWKCTIYNSTLPLMMGMHSLQQYPPFNDVNAQFATVPSL